MGDAREDDAREDEDANAVDPGEVDPNDAVEDDAAEDDDWDDYVPAFGAREPEPPVLCPRCGRRTALPVVYGLLAGPPGPGVVIGGCCITGDDPDRECTTCGFSFWEGYPLAGRVAVVTGVSRRRGIGFAVASRLAGLGASLFLHHWSAHDEDQPWGADDIDEVELALGERMRPGARLASASIDLRDPRGGEALIRAAGHELGHLDILVCNHARSGGDGPLDEVDADDLDTHWAVNARSTILATRAFEAQHDGREGGRVVWFTSGQVSGPMPDEIAYAASKAALAGLTPSVADWLIDRGIVLNTVNPGPVNTGYLDPETTDRPDRLDDLLDQFPTGRFGVPDDPARLVAWLVGDEGRWVVGQVISSEGGFRR